jgi:hypothetical protein
MASDDSIETWDHGNRDYALTGSKQVTLQQANRFLATKQPAQAAPLFARLAEVLADEDHPRHAANLHAQAAQAVGWRRALGSDTNRADSHNEAAALRQSRAALNLFLDYQMDQRTPVFYANITRKLNALGMPGAAETLAQEFGAKLPQPAPVTPPAGRPPACPPVAPSAAPIRSNEAHWVDDTTIECAYCGGLIRPAD